MPLLLFLFLLYILRLIIVWIVCCVLLFLLLLILLFRLAFAFCTHSISVTWFHSFDVVYCIARLCTEVSVLLIWPNEKKSSVNTNRSIDAHVWKYTHIPMPKSLFRMQFSMQFSTHVLDVFVVVVVVVVVVLAAVLSCFLLIRFSPVWVACFSNTRLITIEILLDTDCHCYWHCVFLHHATHMHTHIHSYKRTQKYTIRNKPHLEKPFLNKLSNYMRISIGLPGKQVPTTKCEIILYSHKSRNVKFGFVSFFP